VHSKVASFGAFLIIINAPQPAGGFVILRHNWLTDKKYSLFVANPLIQQGNPNSDRGQTKRETRL
jgi:hypothetical protein